MTETDKTAEIITLAINELKKENFNDVEIAIYLLGGAIPVFIEAAGAINASNFLHDMAEQVRKSESINKVN